jgi:hypothetical protein
VFAAREGGEYTFAMRWGLAAAVVVWCGLCVGCAKQEPEPEYRISASQLGHAIPPGSLAAQLSPAERAALEAQGYEIAVDEDDWEEQAAREAEALAEGELEEDGGGFQRAMDHVGKATVAVTSVAMAVGMVVAPFFLF